MILSRMTPQTLDAALRLVPEREEGLADGALPELLPVPPCDV